MNSQVFREYSVIQIASQITWQVPTTPNQPVWFMALFFVKPFKKQAPLACSFVVIVEYDIQSS
jgi:hypothetical protein